MLLYFWAVMNLKWIFVIWNWNSSLWHLWSNKLATNFVKHWLNCNYDGQEGSFVPLSRAVCSLCFQYFNCSMFLFITRYFPAAQTGRDLLPGGHRCPLHSGRAGLGSTEVALQQRWRVPGRRHGDQPQVARADIRHWHADAFPVNALASHGEIYDGSRKNPTHFRFQLRDDGGSHFKMCAVQFPGI